MPIKITPDFMVFLLGSFAVPTVIVILTFVVRSANGWFYTAGTDFLLSEMTFSFASAALWKDMAPYIRNAYIREVANSIFIVLGLIILVVWYWAVSRVESELNAVVRRNTKARTVPQIKLFLSWSAVVIFFASEIMCFLSP
jgi:hypothetical protein